MTEISQFTLYPKLCFCKSNLTINKKIKIWYKKWDNNCDNDNNGSNTEPNDYLLRVSKPHFRHLLLDSTSSKKMFFSSLMSGRTCGNMVIRICYISLKYYYFYNHYRKHCHYHFLCNYYSTIIKLSISSNSSIYKLFFCIWLSFSFDWKSNKAELKDFQFDTTGSDQVCWISQKSALLFYVGIPVGLVLIFNLLAMIITMAAIFRVRKVTRYSLNTLCL